jgi:hypothetical protein
MENKAMSNTKGELPEDRIKNWWNGKTYWDGKPIGYENCDEPSPKEAFKVVVFFILPYLIIIYFLIKLATNEQR